MPIRGFNSTAARALRAASQATNIDSLPPENDGRRSSSIGNRQCSEGTERAKRALRSPQELMTGGKLPKYEELAHVFLDEEAAIKCLEEHKVVQPINVCPRCFNETKYYHNKKSGDRCTQCSKAECFDTPPPHCEKCQIPNTMHCGGDERGCTNATCTAAGCRWHWKNGKRFHRSIYKNSILQHCRLPKNEFIHMIYLYMLRVPVSTAATILGRPVQTIGKWCRHIRQVIIEDLLHEDISTVAIGGVEEDGTPITCEGDESKFAKRKDNKGRRVSGDWVFGVVERTPARKMILFAVPNRKARTLLPLISTFVKDGSIINADQWKAHNKISELPGKNFQHRTLCHKREFVNKEDGHRTHTQTIEGSWGMLKRQLPIQKRSGFILQEFLWEAMWRRLHERGLWPAIMTALSKADYTQAALKKMNDDRQEDFDDEWVLWEDGGDEDLIYDFSDDEETETEDDSETESEDEGVYERDGENFFML